MSARSPRVAVVGGGFAGLLAAHRLRDLGCSVTVLEAGERVGGKVRTVRRDGWTIDTGAITMAPPEGEVARLLAGSGAAALVPAADGTGRRYLVHRNRPVPVPTTPAEMIATPLLTVAGRLRMLREPFVARGGDSDEPVAAFARRRFGEETAARFIDPLVSGTSGGDPEQLLAAFTFPRLVEFERRAGSVLKGRMRAAREARRSGSRMPLGAWSARGGLGTVADHLATALAPGVRLGAPVVALRQHDGGIEVELASGERLSFEGVVAAVPATALARIDVDVPGRDRLDAIAAIPHASLATVSLGWPRQRVSHPLDGHGLLSPSGERRRLLAATFTSTLFPDRAPVDRVLVTVTLGGVRHPDDVNLADEALIAVARDECEVLLGARGEAEVAEVARWPAAMPLATIGHRERLGAAEAVELASERLAFCGSWHDGLALGEVMRGGVAAADRLAARRGWLPQAGTGVSG